MKKEIHVVLAMIAGIRGLYFISQRSPSSSSAGKWEFPGGKWKFGETFERCIKREIREELGSSFKIKKVEGVLGISGALSDEGTQIILVGLLCKLSSNNAKTEVRHAWVKPEDMEEYDFCKADLPFVKKLQKGDLQLGGVYFA